VKNKVNEAIKKTNESLSLFGAEFHIDSNDWEGVAIALESLKKDIDMKNNFNDSNEGSSKKMLDNGRRNALSPVFGKIIVGTIGKSGLLEKLISEGKVDVSGISGKRECFLIEVVGDDLLIAGSDKRGTIYGIYTVSEMIGVTPWVWWADCVPDKSGDVFISRDFRMESKEPSVKYRGFFMNDEAPSLSGWVGKKFGKIANPQGSPGYDSEFYAKVFELLLRLKGNYFWPVMWNNSFHTDDPRNSALADKMGIVAGTSHHEHMTCADKEWTWAKRGAWNYHTNRDEIYKFWHEGVTARRDYESIVTLGMRGQADTSILGPDATLRDNMALLQGVIDDQREIIKDVCGAADAKPQMIALYKEVEDFYYGDSSSDGGKLLVPDDVTLMLCDDNFGNLRTLPTEEMLKRPGGFGMYYHFDYRGGPVSYEWINQTPLAKVWDNMTTAYDAGIREIWIVNVGDLKPMELPLSYFMQLAYDFESHRKPNKTEEFTRAWAERIFHCGQPKKFYDEIADVLNGYTKLLGARKAEVVLPAPSTVGLFSFDEAERVLDEFEALAYKAEKLYSKIEPEKKAAFFQLVLYPTRAAFNVYKTNINAAFSLWFAENNLPVANSYAQSAKEAFEANAADTEYFNTKLSDGKWDGIMRQNHMGYTSWDGPKITVVPNEMPATGYVTPPTESGLAVRLQYRDKILRSDEQNTFWFTNFGAARRYIDIFNTGENAFDFTVETTATWLKLETTNGSCKSRTRLWLSLDSEKALENTPIEACPNNAKKQALVKISGAGKEINIPVCADVLPKEVLSKLPANTYIIGPYAYASINPAKFTKNTAASGAEFTVIKNYGRDTGCDSVKILPNGSSFAPGLPAPMLEYSFCVLESQDFCINVFLAPSNPPRNTTITPLAEQMRFSVQINENERFTAVGLPKGDFTPGHGVNWDFGVMDNSRIITIPQGVLSEGLHTLRIFAVDPGIVIQKIVIAPAAVKPEVLTYTPQTTHFMNSFFGPPESFCV